MSITPVFLRSAVIALVLGQCSHPAWAEVVVFTDARHNLTSAGGVRVVHLDAPKQIEAALSLSLPPSADQATALVRQHLAQNPETLKQLAASYQGVAEAFSLGVRKIPAVVVDRRYVVYGETDVQTALARIAIYRGRER
jgi:integrating conjugative element protein (TIGR03757 family)